MNPESFRCLVVEKTPSGTSMTVRSMPTARLAASSPDAELEIAVHWSSLNYKDALAATGHPGVARKFPHIPGIDAAGVVLRGGGTFKEGDEVLVTGYDLGQGHWGGWSERIRVPVEWVVPLPAGMSMRESMIWGTAGFTAAQCVLALERNEVQTSSGEVIVSGATGGVGSLAVRLLAHLGYEVVAVTGKLSMTKTLLELGAKRVMGRNELLDESHKPLLSARWAGGVDTVGGHQLTSLLRGTHYGGCVAACGLVGGAELAMTLYPFLLRGVTLCGIASADCPRPKRELIWNLLGSTWQLPNLERLVSQVTLEHLPNEVSKILAGGQCGRVIVNVPMLS